MHPSFQLILGGARSGKSHYALSQGDESSFASRLFLATASPGDEEMVQRIKTHQRERGSQWQTLEAPYHLGEALQGLGEIPKDLLVIDCATLWISNLLCGMGGNALGPSEILLEFEKLFQVLSLIKGKTRLVSNEVGLGIVPESLLGRQFRDLQGTFNQRAAAFAGQVIVMTAGLPQKLK